MRIVQVAEFGGPSVMVPGEAPDPVPGPGEVLIDVAFADTVFLDVIVRRGAPGPWAVSTPYVPGCGVAGRVAAVGDGVDAGLTGRAVIAKPGASAPRPEGDGGTVAEAAAGSAPVGGYASRAVAPADGVIPVPEGVEIRDAAALINDGLTAMQLLRAAAIKPGERVLVQPAGGGLGTLLVQFAKDACARVAAAAGSEAKREKARELGADLAVDYTADGWEERVRAAFDGEGADVVLDGAGTSYGAAAFRATAPGGRYFAFGAPSGGFADIDPEEAARRGVTVTGLLELGLEAGDATALPAAALGAVAAGRVRPVVGRTFPLEKASDAHAAIEARSVVGKTLLVV